MRDHRKLTAFELADKLVMQVYPLTKKFPDDERYGLSSQLRRAVISVASNIVEGCARSSEAEYLRFLEIAHSSAREICYQLSVAERLGYTGAIDGPRCTELAEETARVLAGLIRSLKPQASSLKPS